jgi:hypothetical protein
LVDIIARTETPVRDSNVYRHTCDRRGNCTRFLAALNR